MVDVSTATLVTRPARSKLDAPTTATMIIAFVALLAAGVLLQFIICTLTFKTRRPKARLGCRFSSWP